MRVTLSFRGIEKPMRLSISNWEWTLGELVDEILGFVPDGPIWVNERKFEAGTALADVTLLEGSTISDEPRPVVKDRPGWTIRLSAGSDVDFPRPLREGTPITIGRSPEANIVIDSPSTSWAHATVVADGNKLHIRDLQSSNGTYIGGERISEEGFDTESTNVTVVVGGAALTITRGSQEPKAPSPGSLPNVTQARTVPFNRPPRPGELPKPEKVTAPNKKAPSKPSAFSWAVIISPLILAMAMVVVMQNPRFAAFALLSPIIGIGTWLENRRCYKRETKKEDARFKEAVADFNIDIEEAANVERERLADIAPDPGICLIRSSLPSTRLWQRRFGSFDFLSLHVGIGAQPWKPPVETSASAKLEDELLDIVDDFIIPNCPIRIDLDNAGVVGIYGDRENAVGLARSLLAQAATHCGPADLSIGVFADADKSEHWEWTGWLAHTTIYSGDNQQQWLGFTRRRSEGLLRSLRESIDGQIASSFLLLVDSEVLLEGRESVLRELLGHGRSEPGGGRANDAGKHVSGIVIAESEDQLPASCTTVIEAREDSAGAVKWPETREIIDNVLLARISDNSAQYIAQNLAHFDDPELQLPGATLPHMVHMLPLLQLPSVDAKGILDSWRESRGYLTPVGLSESGVYGLDLLRDGPHGLVGGTTGSGKSEFLRTLIAGLAARVDPQHLTFILIDFKGGAAFAACNDLPHTIGTISNLDEQLANRAITALEAEMTYRQLKFAQAGENVDNLDAYLATNPEEPMPRLLVVIDEFAQLAKDFPDILTSLVSVAAVGRTLGVHMILATQRPAGVVNDDILANTNMRVALRVQSREDSSNVIGVPDAASIARHQKGRAYIKLGEDDITPIQTALVTGRSNSEDEEGFEAEDVVFGTDPTPRSASRVSKSDGSDLDELIAAIIGANAAAGFAPPRRVWPEPLGEYVNLELKTTSSQKDDAESKRSPNTPWAGGMTDDKVTVALVDDPQRQRQYRGGWDLREGNLLLCGIPGSGTTTALASIGLALADAHAPDDLDIFILDMGSSPILASFKDLPHLAGYADTGAGGSELIGRLLKYLRNELNRRKETPGPHRKTIVLVNGLATLREEYQDHLGSTLLENLYRVYSEGPSVGIHWAVSTTRAKSVPGQMDDITTQKWLFRLADPYDYSVLGIRPNNVPPTVPGRFVFSTTKLHAHIATPEAGYAEAINALIAKWKDSAKKPSIIARLPDRVWAHELAGGGTVSAEPWVIPVGIAESDLQPFSVELFGGEHMLVAGPVRSGKSSVLAGIAATLRALSREQNIDLAMWGIGGRRSPLRNADLDKWAIAPDEAPEFFVAARLQNGPLAIFIDDAEQFDDADGLIAQLIAENRPDMHIFTAGRADDLRTMYGHWTKSIRRSRCGILLHPNVDMDGELLGVRIPRRAPVAMKAGRGYAGRGGIATLIQSATGDLAQ